MTPVHISTIEYAIRYCIGRQSYAFDDGMALANRHWLELSNATRSDVHEAIGKMTVSEVRRRWPNIARHEYGETA